MLTRVSKTGKSLKSTVDDGLLTVDVSFSRIFLIMLLLFCFNVRSSAQFFPWAEKRINMVYDIIEGDSNKPHKKIFFVLPIWGVYPETGWRLGISLVQIFHTKQDSTRPSLARLNMQYTQYDQYSIRPYTDIYLSRNRYNIRSYLTYSRFAEYYWGIGQNVTDATKELYHFDLLRYNMRVTRQVIPNLYAGPQLQFESMFNMSYNGIDNKGTSYSILDSSQVEGNHGSFTLGAGLVLAYDNRNQIYYPTKGAYLEVSALLNNKAIGSEYNFINTTIDLRKYSSLTKSTVLALQGYVNMNAGTLPFRQLAVMGSDMIMRGYYNGRFRDMNMAATQFEFRQHVWGPLAITGFAGLGNVGASFGDLGNNIKYNYGGGLRILAFRREHVNIRIDYGRGNNGIQGFYFTMNEAF